MNFLAKLLGGGVVDSVGKVVGMFTGDRAAREAGYHEESMESHRQFSSEFQVENRTKFDSLIDGLNRLPRPTIVAMVIYYFVVAVKDPAFFQIINLALDTVPEMMWQITFAIIAFYFVAREFQKSRDKKMAASKGGFDEHMRRVAELQSVRAKPLAREDLESEMADTSKPLSDAAIAEWNRKNTK